ncbi:TVP38/TMEM64 family protein [Serinicoccus kebangsaanensis]|uniref:TVP38/TMEM64 family protein n=1 Tax=Serinicoccus kebangsaanensis TaxID=2602069 RepID=UPI001EE1D4E5|nr:TVP38/TMEM64 family protein [Serinicoccus kebangsaanensis]
MTTGLGVGQRQAHPVRTHPAPPRTDRPATSLVTGPRSPGASPAPSPEAQAYLRWARRVAIGGWVALAGAIVWGVRSGVLTSLSSLRDFLDGFGALAPLVYTLLGAGEAVFPVVPGSATIIAGPILFGPVPGLVAAYCATCLGSVAVFALSRHVGQDLLTARFRPATVQRWLGWLQHRHFTRWFALGIALPLAPDDLLCYLAGLSRMRWSTFVLVVLLLKPWALVVYTFGVLTLLSRWVPWLAG